MQENNQPEKPHRRKNTSRHLKPVFIILILLILAAAGTTLYLFSGAGDNQLSVTEESLDDTSTQSQPVAAGENIPQYMSDTLPGVENTPVDSAEEDPVGDHIVSELQVESPEEKQARECRILAQQIHGFFAHIDSEDYIQNFELPESSQQYFIDLANKLLENPPVVSRESDDLYTILKNMAHFFRVIGKDNIILIKTILDRERDKIEDVAAELYQWTAWKTCEEDLLQFSPTLKDMYEYAGFFLNTMGGRSYLFRRDSRSRLLVNYYSVLLIERANQEGVNRHGIDITQIIPQLVQEIDASNQLIYKENYIDSLYNLLEKYE